MFLFFFYVFLFTDKSNIPVIEKQSVVLLFLYMVVEQLKTTQSFIEGTHVDHTHLMILYQVSHVAPTFGDPLPFIQQFIFYFLIYLFKAVQYWTLCK